MDALGNVYFADFRNNAIKEWNPTTQQVTSLVSQGLSFPNAVALDGQGNVYLVDGNNNALKEWNAAKPDGEHAGLVGSKWVVWRSHGRARQLLSREYQYKHHPEIRVRLSCVAHKRD